MTFKIVVTLILGYSKLITGTCLNLEGISCDPDLINFYLYPNPADLTDFDELIYGDNDSVTASRFDSTKNLVLLTHGFVQNFRSEFPVVIKDAYLKNGFTTTHNIVAVDWGRLSGATAPAFPLPVISNLMELPQYIAAVANVKIVGVRISEFIIFLINNGETSADRVHLIGQSLGAHASGYAGTTFEAYIENLLARITGTDPAGPLYYPPFQPLIGPNVATFVDIVHTNRGAFGYPFNLGQVDFNVNGGGPYQPGCFNLTDVFCAHNKAPIYYAQSIADATLMATKHCLLCLSPTATVTFGEPCHTGTSGLYDISLTSVNT